MSPTLLTLSFTSRLHRLVLWTFTVLSDGRARLGFITAGTGITMTSTLNGVLYHFVTSHQGGGIWRIDEYIP